MNGDPPREIIDRRMRVHLLSALHEAAQADDLGALLDAEWMDELAESVEAWGPNGAISSAEREAVLRLYRTWKSLREEEARILRERSGGKTVHTIGTSISCGRLAGSRKFIHSCAKRTTCFSTGAGSTKACGMHRKGRFATPATAFVPFPA